MIKGEQGPRHKAHEKRSVKELNGRELAEVLGGQEQHFKQSAEELQKRVTDIP